MSRLYVLLNIEKAKKKYLKVQPGGQGYEYIEDFQKATTFTWDRARSFWKHDIRGNITDNFFAMELETGLLHHLATQAVEPLYGSSVPKLTVLETEQEMESDVEFFYKNRRYPKGEFSMKSADIGINQQKLVELNKNYDLEYDNSELIEKACQLVEAYNAFYTEIEKHQDIGGLKVYFEKAFEDIKHVTEFSKLSAASSYALLSLQQKILRSRRMAKDSYEIYYRAKTITEQKKTFENLGNYLDSLTDREYNFRTNLLEEVVVDNSEKQCEFVV